MNEMHEHIDDIHTRTILSHTHTHTLTSIVAQSQRSEEILFSF